MTTISGKAEHCQVFRPVARSSRTKRLLVIPIALFSFALSGCGPRRVRADFAGYENSYAITSNREVLLNLARLAQHDPTYFFQLGQISSSYQMQAGVSGIIQNVPPSGASYQVPGGSGTPTVGYQNYSAASFIPVSSDANARLLLSQIPEDEFYNLYEQGWRVDQLFRLLVDRIEVTLPLEPGHPEEGCRIEVIRNVPPPYYLAPNYTMSPRLLSRYIEFLRVSAIVYALQSHGLLQITGSDTFSPLDRNAKLKRPPSAKQMIAASANNEVWEQQKDHTWLLGKKGLRPRFQLSVINQGSGADKGYGADVSKIERILDEVIQNDPGLTQLQGQGAPELTDVLEILSRGFAIGGAATGADSSQGTEVRPCESGHPQEDTASPGQGSKAEPSQQKTEESGISAHLVMRSLMGVMAAAAQEQRDFDALMNPNNKPDLQLGHDRLICNVHDSLLGYTPATPSTPIEKLCAASSPPFESFKDLVPAVEQLPVLRLTWPSQVSPRPENEAASLKRFGLTVKYRGKDYWISDFTVPTGDKPGQDTCGASDIPPLVREKQCSAEEDQYWNRDSFRLICQLSSQMSVDISKFPLPSILQLPIQ